MSTDFNDKSYIVDARYSNFYVGGDVCWSADGTLIYCQNTTEITVVEVATGQVVKAFRINENEDASMGQQKVQADDNADEDVIYSFALSPSNEHLVTGHRSGLLRLWSVETGSIVKLWKAQHKGPVVKLEFSANSNHICSSGADSTLRVWDYANSRCLSVLKDFPGPALLVYFHPNPAKTEIYAAGSDNTIYCWNYMNRNLLYELRGHLSQVTALTFEQKEDTYPYLASVSRDKVLIIWQLSDGTQYKVIPMYEELEGVCFIKKNNVSASETNVIVACSKGNLKLVNCSTSTISTLVDSVDYEIRYMLQCKETDQLAVITAEHNILIYRVSAETSLDCVKQLIGFNDDILDLCFLGENDRFLAVATNSKNFKVYDTDRNMDCKIIAGHTDTVITLSATGGSINNLLLTSGKDFSIFLWELEPEKFTITCVAKNISSHTSTIGCISFGCNAVSILASVSQDGSLKVWNLKKTKSKNFAFNIKYSAIAHEKEVNSVAFSPNNKILATASQDKTAKLWSSDSSALMGTLRGHTRGVWCVRFSPVDQVLLTSSSDCSLRLWSVASLACLKRFDQECTVLRSEFIDHGKYIVSASSDGLIKIWNIKTNECVQTLDEHTDRVWSLAVSGRSKKYFFSGAADSKLVKWYDNTDGNRNLQIDKRQQLLQQEQTLQTLLHQKDHMQKAFLLALTLGKAKATYNIANQFIQQRETSVLKSIISALNSDQRATLLEHVKAWNTNTRFCKVANYILNYILLDLIAYPNERSYNMHGAIEALTPYVERHFNKITELKKDLAFLEFMVQCI